VYRTSNRPLETKHIIFKRRLSNQKSAGFLNTLRLILNVYPTLRLSLYLKFVLVLTNWCFCNIPSRKRGTGIALLINNSGRFTTEKETRYALHRKVGGPGRTVWMGPKNLTAVRIRAPDCSESLYRLSYSCLGEAY